jgi:hypothetical protein
VLFTFAAGQPVIPFERLGIGERSEGRRMNWLFDPPAHDQQPEHKHQLPEERDKEESKMRFRVQIGLQAIGHPAESINDQQYSDDPVYVAGATNQVTQQNEMDSKNYQAD